MKNLFCFTLLALFAIQIHAQNLVSNRLLLLDSVRNIVSNNELDRGNRILDDLYNYYEINSLTFDSLLLQAKLIESQIIMRRGQYLELLHFNNHLESSLLESKLNLPEQRALIYSNKSVALMEMNRLSEALTTGQKAYTVAKSRKQHEDLTMVVITGRLASAYSKLKNHQQSISLNTETKLLIDKINGSNRIRSICLNNLAVAYTDLGQYEKAESYIQQAIRLQINDYGKDYLDLHWDYFNLGNVLQMKGEFKEAIEYFKKGNQLLLKHNSLDRSSVAENYLRIGECELYAGQKERAKESFDYAANIYNQLEPDERYRIPYLYSSQGNFYYEIGEFDQAINLYKKSIAVQSAAYGEGHPTLAQDIIYLALSYIGSGNKKEAIKHTAAALDMARYNGDEFDPLKIVDNYSQHLVLTRAGKVYMEIYNQSKDRKYLALAQAYLNQAILISDQRKIQLQEDVSKILLVEEDHKIYELLIEASYQNYLIDQNRDHLYRAFEYSELARRSTVLESIRSQQINNFAAVPDNILTRERQLKREIVFVKSLLEEASYQPELANLFSDSLRQVLFKKKTNFYTFLDSIEDKFPDYYQHRFANNPPDIRSIQIGLAPNQTIIEYFDGPENIYAFSLSKEQVDMKKIEKMEEIEASIDKFSSNLYANPDSILLDPDHSLTAYSIRAQELYNFLLTPLAIDASISELMIIPDHLESNIPFGILLYSAPGDADIRSWPYAFDKYDIHYTQSILGWLELKKLKKNRSNGKLIAFAPVYTKNSSIEQDTTDQNTFAMLVRGGQLGLPGSLNEVNDILKIIPGRKFIEAEATERKFMEQVKDHKIIHLSAHTFLDNRNPAYSNFLLYNEPDSIYDGKLTAAEICQMDLKAELAVLSACHTGSGRSYKGEGVMSLGRSFAYAGVPSTLLSLWKIPDNSTSKIIPLFYKFLAEGMPKHQALNEARKSYLQNTNIDEKCHPYYWGGFVLHGSMDPLTSNSGETHLLFYLFGAIFLFYLGYRIWKSRSKNESGN